MTQSLPNSHLCSFCSGTAILEEQDYGGICKYLVYYCHSCKNGFTTTESDTISIARIQSTKRKIRISTRRKEKIKKIFNR